MAERREGLVLGIWHASSFLCFSRCGTGFATSFFAIDQSNLTSAFQFGKVKLCQLRQTEGPFHLDRFEETASFLGMMTSSAYVLFVFDLSCGRRTKGGGHEDYENSPYIVTIQ